MPANDRLSSERKYQIYLFVFIINEDVTIFRNHLLIQIKDRWIDRNLG